MNLLFLLLLFCLITENWSVTIRFLQRMAALRQRSKVYAEHHLDIEKKIFNGYKKDRRPVRNASDAVEVGMEFSMSHVSIDEEHQTMTISARMEMTWDDEYLTWDPKKYGNVSQLYVDLDNIWRPQLSIENRAKNSYIFWNHIAYLTSNGENKTTVMIQTRYDFKVGCLFDFYGFPNDGSRCSMTIAFQDATSQEITFNMEKFNSKALFPKAHAANYIIDTINQQGFEICEASKCMSNVYTVFQLQRYFPYMFVIFKLPSNICSLLNILSFYILSKVICCYLTMFNLLLEFIFLHDMMLKLPQASSDLPKCVIYYFIMMSLTFLTLLFHFATLFGVQVIDEKRRTNRLRPIIGIILALIYFIVGYFYL